MVPSPGDDSRVVSIHLASVRHAPTYAVDSVVAVAGQGLVGDRYFGSRHRHVSLQSEDALAQASARLGSPVTAERTRRNVIVSGGRLPRTPGDRIRVGAVELEVVRIAAPCRVMDAEIGPGAKAALHDRGGVICRVLASGSITVGDGVGVGTPD